MVESFATVIRSQRKKYGGKLVRNEIIRASKNYL